MDSIAELIEFLANNKGNEQVLTALAPYAPKPELTSDAVKPYLETEEGLKLVQPIVDRRVNEAVNTYRDGHFKEEVEAGVTAGVKAKLDELNPPESDADRRIRELEARDRARDEEIKKERLRSDVLTEATNLGMKPWWIDNLAADTIEGAKSFMARYNEEFAEAVKTEVELRLKGSPKPGSGAEDLNGGGKPHGKSLSEMTPAEIEAAEEAGELDAIISAQ